QELVLGEPLRQRDAGRPRRGGQVAPRERLQRERAEQREPDGGHRTILKDLTPARPPRRLRCPAMPSTRAETFLLVDGENIDATLGGSLLGRRPAPEERPRWDRVREYGRAVWEQPLRGLFYLNGSGQIPMSFVQALDALEDRPGLPSGP